MVPRSETESLLDSAGIKSRAVGEGEGMLIVVSYLAQLVLL